jgi:hypothetical protein
MHEVVSRVIGLRERKKAEGCIDLGVKGGRVCAFVVGHLLSL